MSSKLHPGGLVDTQGERPEPTCSAHGNRRCTWCSLNPGSCITNYYAGCSTYETDGMHWDTCPNRLRGADNARRRGLWPLDKPFPWLGQAPTKPPPSRPSTWDTDQPMDGAGYVWAQVGWIGQDGATYGLDVSTIDATRLKPLYICLGRLHNGPLAEECA